VLVVAVAGVYWHYAPVHSVAGKAILPVAGGSANGKLQAGDSRNSHPAAAGSAESSPADPLAAGTDSPVGSVAQAGHLATDLSGISAALSRPAARHLVVGQKENGGIGGAAFNETAEESGEETINKTADGT